MVLGDITYHQFRNGYTEELFYFGGDAVSPVNNDLKCGQAAVTTHACRSIIDVSVVCLSKMARSSYTTRVIIFKHSDFEEIYFSG